MIGNKYKIINKISEGVFGEVFKGENIRSGEVVAIKLEKRIDDIKTLKNEAKIYQYLGKKDGFPQLKWYGTSETLNYIVLDFLGEPLTKLIEYYKVFSLKTVLILGVQIIKRVQIIHDICLLHRDIKSDNFLFGYGINTNKLYLIDLGFCKRYSYDGKHIEQKKNNHLIGSPNFVSLNVHNGIEPSRRDDIISCIYIIAYMLLGKLEWFDCQCIKKMIKLKTQLIDLQEIPSFIKLMLLYCNELKFEDKPNYQYLINIMYTLFKDNNYINDIKYEWS